MPSALIKFEQESPGPGEGPDGEALIGVAGTAVTVSNVDDTDVEEAQFEILYVPPASALTAGVKQAYSSTLTWDGFEPDVSGCYVIRLRVRDELGNESVDDRVFGVLEDTGRLIPPFAFGRSLNFGGQTQGWLPYARAYFEAVDQIDRNENGDFGDALTDADATIAIGDGRWRALPAATLSTGRTITLGTTDAVKGDTITIVRHDTTANTLAVVNGGPGAGTLHTMAVSAKAVARFRFDGTDWQLRSFGEQ